VFKNIPALRELDRGAEAYREAYRLYPENDYVSRRQCLAQLGSLELARLKIELDGERRPEVLSNHLDAALRWYGEVLRNTASNDILGLAQAHNQLGVAYQYMKEEQGAAFEHFRRAIEYFDEAGESYEAASARNNAAQVLMTLQRFSEAAVLAHEALTTFESFDPSAPLTVHLRRLIARIERDTACNGKDANVEAHRMLLKAASSREYLARRLPESVRNDISYYRPV